MIGEGCFAAVPPVERDLQLVADLAGGHIVVGVDVQPVVILRGADLGPEHRVHVKGRFQVKIQEVIHLGDLLRHPDLPRGEMARRGDLPAVQRVQEPGPSLVAVEVRLAVRLIDRFRDIPHGKGLPAIHHIDSGKLPLIKVQLKGAGDLSCILHAHQHHVLKRLGTDLLRLMQHLLKGGGPMLSPQVGSQEPGGVQKFQRPFYLEAAVLPGLPDAEDGELPRGLQLLSGLLILLPEFLTDAAVLLLGNQLVDELVQIVPELILHSLILQMAAQGVVPSLIQPHTNVSAFHSASPFFSKIIWPSGHLGARSGPFSMLGWAERLGLAGAGALRSRNSRTDSGTVRSYSSVSASFMRFCTEAFSFFR